MPLSLPNKDKKKKKIDEVEERLSPKKVSDLSFSEARAIREQYGSLKNYELATDKNRAKRIDEQMQDLSARRLVDAATSRGTPVGAESYGKNNKWNDYTTVMSERKSDYDRAVEKLKKDLDVYSPIADVSGVKNYLDATKAGYEYPVAYGKAMAERGAQFKNENAYRTEVRNAEAGWGDKYRDTADQSSEGANSRWDIYQENKRRIEELKARRDNLEYKADIPEEYAGVAPGVDPRRKPAATSRPTTTSTETKASKVTKKTKSEYDTLTEEIDRLEAENRQYENTQMPTDRAVRSVVMSRDANAKLLGDLYDVDTIGDVREGDYEKYYNSSPLIRWMVAKEDPNQETYKFDRDWQDEYGLVDSYANYEYLTDEEKSTYFEMLHTAEARAESDREMGVSEKTVQQRYDQAVKDANSYIDELEIPLAARREKEAQEYRENAGTLGNVVGSILSVPLNLVGGAAAFLDDMGNLVQGKKINPYSVYHAPLNFATGERSATSEDIVAGTNNFNILGFNLGDTYQALMSAADSVAGGLLFGRAYTITMGMGASASRARELFENGASNGDIFASALTSGIVETVTEYASIDKFLSNFLESSPINKRDIILKVLAQGGVEASEEFAADILNAIQDEAILGSQSEWSKKINELVDGGMSKDEAGRKVFFETIGEALKSAAGGFISGVAMAGGAGVVQGVQLRNDIRNEGNYIIDSEGVEALRNVANEMTGAPKSVSKLIEKTGKKPTAKNVGKLSRALEQTIVNEADAETRSEKVAKYALAREGVDLSDIKAREGTKLYNNVDVSEKVSDTGTTVETETGGEITIDEKNPITQRDGKTYLNTSAGEILQDDIKYSSEKEAQLYEYVSDLPQSVANAIVENYKGQENVRGYVNGMRDGILLYGYNNIENAPKNTAFATLDKADQQYALARGRALAAEDIKAAEAKVQSAVGNHVAVKETATTSGERVMNLNEIGLKATPAVAKKIGAGGTAGAVYTKGDVDLNSAMGRADGLLAYVYSSIAGNSVVLYDSKTVKDADLKNANGKHVASDGTIYLDVRAEAGKNVTGGIAYTLGHELTHEAEQWAKKEYAAFKKFLYENYIEVSGKTNGKTKWTVEDLIAKKMSDLDTTDRAYAESEVVADACERMLLDSDAMEKLAELQDKEPDAFKKILDFIKRALEKIVGKFNSIREVYETMGAENTRIESKLVQEFGDNLKKLQDMWSDMVVKAAQNRAAAVESNSLAYDFGASEQMAEEGSVQYSKVTDKKTLDFLNNQDYLRVFRAMALIDGKLYPPMATKVVKEGESKASLQNPTIIGEWYQSDERPDLANDKGMFPLRKPNGKTIWARYNPYWHTSATPLNDQFDEAHKRPELVVVEGIIPKSELTSGYKAYKAKDAVGATKWHSGEVAKQLKGAKARTVYLSRWFMAERVVPEAEVAKIIADTLRGENIYFPTNVVTPKLLEELRKTDVVLENSIDEKGNKIPEKVRKAAREGRTAEATETQYSRKVTPEENARYMELAKDPQKNEAELQRMVEEAAELAMPDSAIRGKDGKLLKVFHGTEEDFNVFDTSIKGGVNGTAEGFGIYTSPDRRVTEHYGQRQIGMFANIKRPARSDQKTIRLNELSNLIKSSCEYEARTLVDDGYDSIEDAIKDTWISNYVNTYEASSMNAAYMEAAQSILRMNDSDMSVVQEVMAGMGIRDYADAMVFYRESLVPVTGIDGFATEWNERETNEGIPVILALESNQLKSADPVTYDSSGNIIPLSKRFNENNDDIRYSRKISPEESKRYLDLAQNPEKNTAALEKMVVQAAKEAGYDTPKLYHGTGRFGFTRANGYLFATDSKETAGTYSGTKTARNISEDTGTSFGMYQFYANTDGMLAFDANGAETNHIALGDIESRFNRHQMTKTWHTHATINQIIKYAKENGYTGVIVKNVVDSATPESRKTTAPATDYVFFSPQSQVKSADPVVYDNNGNVIPLEERFNPENDDIRYSYKGRSSLTTPTGSLNINDIRDKQGNENLKIAYKMDREGVDSEKIRLATGWFKGYDGKWRSEIDDSDAKLASWIILGKGKRYMEERARNNTGDLRDKVFALQDRLAKSNKSNGANSDESKALRKEIRQTKKQREAASDLEFKISQNRLNLSDILDHPKLYENYPQLKDAVVHLSYTDGNDLGGAWGSTVLGSDEITLATNLNSREDILGTLMHEIQHVIQGIEGFASGANVEYWARRNKAESEDTRKAKLRLASVEDKLRNVDYNGNTAASPIKTAMSYAYIVDQLRTDKEGTANYDYDTEAKERYEERAKEGGYSDLLKEYLEAYQDVQIANMEAEDYPRAFADYQRTAGEIEARDVTGRLRMTEEERKAKRPDIDRNDVLFYSDQYSRKLSESYAVRDIVDRALKRLDPSSAEYRAMAKYKAELDTLDNMRAQLDEAIKNDDRQAQIRLTNNIKTQRGMLNRIENSASMKNVASMRDVTRLADDAKKLREMLKLQGRETNGTIAKQRSVNAAASEIMEKYGIKRGKGELNELLSNYYTKMMQSVNNETMTREAALDQAREAAEWIARHVPDEIQYDDGAIEALDMLRGYKVKLNDNQRQNIRAKYDNISGWRRAVGGYITLSNEGKYLDELWPEWAERAPGYFTNETISDADMPERLAEIIDSLKKSRETVIEVPGQYEYDLERAANDVYEAFWNIEPEQTVADKYADRIKTLKAEHAKLMSDMRKSFRDTIREERSEMYAEAKERARDYNEKLDLRRRVRKIKDDLTKRLDKPTIKKFIPKELRTATSELLSALNLVNEKNEPSQRTLERIAKLQAIYDSYKDENIVYDKQVSEWLSELRDTVGSKSISELTKDELKSVYKILKAFTKNITEVAQVKSLYATGVSTEKTVDMVAKEWMRNIERINPALSAYFNTMGKLLGRPELVFRIFGNMDRNSISTKVYDMMNAAQLEYNRIRQEGNRLFEEMFEGKENEKYLKELHDTKELYDIGLKDASGKPVEVTKDFALWLYRVLMNDNGVKHVATTGGIMPDFKKYYNGGEAYGKKATRVVGVLNETSAVQNQSEWEASNVNDILKSVKDRSADIEEKIEKAKSEGDYAKVKELQKERDNVWAAWDQVNAEGKQILFDTVRKKISDILTPQDKRFLELAAKFYDEWSKGYMNKASNERHGIDIADEPNYTRLHTAEDYRGVSFDKNNMESALGTENMGFTKRRVGATNPIYFEGLSTAIAKHIDEVATYAAYLNPLYDLRKILDYNEGGIEQKGTVRAKLTGKFGKSATNYIYRLAANAKGQSTGGVGDIETVEKISDKLLGRTAEAALTANGRVIAYQAVSALNAATELGYGTTAKTFLTKLVKKAPRDLIAKYTPVLEVRRSNGSSDEVANMKRIAKNRGVLYKLTYPATHAIQAMDLWTVGRLWFASESYVKKHNKNLKPGSEEFYQAVGKKFTDVVELTQPNYTPMQRNQLQRSKNPLARALSMFKTQPFQNLNNAIGASFQFAHDVAGIKNGTTTKAEARESGAKLYRSISSLVISSAMMAVINAAWISLLLHGHWRWRDDETGEFDWDDFGRWFIDEALTRLFSTDPLTSEAYSFIGSKIFGRKYYPGFSMPQVEVVTDALQSLSDSVDVMIDKDKKWDPKKEGRDLASKIGRLFGIPVDSIVKPIEGIYQNTQDIINGEFGSFNAGYEYKNKQLAAQMLYALETDDEEAYEKARGKFPGTKTQTPEEQADSALKTLIGDMYKNDRYTREETKENLEEYFNMDKEDIEELLDKWDYADEHGSQEGYNKYEDFYEAVRTGKNLKAEIKDLQDRLGVESSTLASQITQHFKPIYKEMSNKERASLKGYLLNAYVVLGYDRDKKSKDIDKWLED